MADQGMIIGLDGPLLAPYYGNRPEQFLANELEVALDELQRASEQSLCRTSIQDRRTWLKEVLRILGVYVSASQRDSLLRAYVRQGAQCRPRQPDALAVLQRLHTEADFAVCVWSGSDPIISEVGRQAGIKSPEVRYFARAHCPGREEHELGAVLVQMQLSATDTIFIHSDAKAVIAAEKMGLWGYLLTPNPSESDEELASRHSFDIAPSLTECLELL